MQTITILQRDICLNESTVLDIVSIDRQIFEIVVIDRLNVQQDLKVVGKQ